MEINKSDSIELRMLSGLLNAHSVSGSVGRFFAADMKGAPYWTVITKALNELGLAEAVSNNDTTAGYRWIGQMPAMDTAQIVLAAVRNIQARYQEKYQDTKRRAKQAAIQAAHTATAKRLDAMEARITKLERPAAVKKQTTKKRRPFSFDWLIGT